MKTVGVIGLGNMGRGMALSLKRGGFNVLGYDAAPGVADKLQEEGVQARACIADIARDSDVLILSLPTSEIVEQVVLGVGGVAASAKPGLIVVDTTTAEPGSTRKVAAALAECKVGFVDGPVSGGPKGAATATMTMVLGGADEDVAAVEPILAVISAKRVHVGPAVQDLWMLASDDAAMRALLDGYTQLRDFEHAELALVPALRAMRQLHYAGWIAQRWHDPAFPAAFPFVAEARWWDEHIADLHELADVLA